MKKVAIPLFITIAIFSFTFTACGVSKDGSDGNIVDKMAIFSLISLAVFSIIHVSIGERRRKNIRSSEKVDPIQQSFAYSLSTTNLTSYPVYVWDCRDSFHKIVFHPDGVLLKSSSVSTNGLDPSVTSAGVWALTSDGKVKVTLNSSGTTKIYTRISKNSSRVLMQPDFGLVEAWFLGIGSLANIQISIFGFSASVSATMKFTTFFVSGRSFYWATYPCIIVTRFGDVAVNDETTYGMTTFNEDGVLIKSIANMINHTPNYTPLFSGIWTVDDNSGVLTMKVASVATTASILTRESEDCELLIHTPSENKIWFCNPTNAIEELESYISEGCKLI